MAIVTQANRSATVHVALDCRLLVLDDEAFDRLLERHPPLYEEVAAIVSRRLSRTLCGEGARRHHIVGVDNRGRWPERSAAVTALAASLER